MKGVDRISRKGSKYKEIIGNFAHGFEIFAIELGLAAF